VLYWMTTNLWTVGQGLITRQLMPRPAAPERRSSRTPPKEVAAPAPAVAPEQKADSAPAPASSSEPRRVKRKKKKKARPRR
jgi:membrane protein insertase Oxa1/YidC/SpoIIIJ